MNDIFPRIPLPAKFSARNVIIVFLSVTTLFGLLSGLVYAVNLDLNSDMIVPAMVAKEVVNYHNFQFFFPASDPYLFTDVYTFHLIPQALSGYSPLVLKLTAYVMFLAVVGIFSYILYTYSGIINALIFSALFTNLNPDAYVFFLSPDFHIGTLLATGVLLLLFSVERIKNASTGYILVACLVAGLIFLSDSIFLAFFVLPLILYYVYFYRFKSPGPEEVPAKAGKSKKEMASAASKRQKERSSLDKAVVMLIVFVALSFVVTSYFGENINIDVPNFIPTPTSLVHLDTMVNDNLPVLTHALTMLLNSNLYSLVNGSFNIYYLFISIIFLSLVAYSLLVRKLNARYLYWIFLVSAIIMISGFLFTDWAKDLGSARYLIFAALAIFAVIALAYRDDNKIGYNLNTLFIVAVIILLLSTVPVSVAKISGMDYQPEKEEYAFIDYLKDNNFTYGFSDYSIAHDLTYLSGEQVVIRPIQIKTNGFMPISWLTTKRWYLTRHTSFVLIANKNDPLFNDMINQTTAYPPTNTYSYKEYVIYQYTSNETKDVKWFY